MNRAMSPWSLAALADLSEAWRVGRSAHSLRAEDGDAAGAILAVLDAIHAGKHAGLDMRTFSRRCFGDSKLVEGVATSVASALRRHAGVEGATTKETMAAAGLVKWPMPILIRAVLVNRVSGERLTVSPYVGLPADRVVDFNFATEPAYFLTIENLTSFYRQCLECQDDGAVLYTGGFPSPRALNAIRHLGAQVREAHRFHWGDIDGGGVRIFHHIEDALPGLKPHLMSADLAKSGKPMDKDGNRKSLSKIASINSPIAGLAQWLISPDGRCLEQEELDPQSPKPIDL